MAPQLQGISVLADEPRISFGKRLFDVKEIDRWCMVIKHHRTVSPCFLMKHVIFALVSGALLCAAPTLPDAALQPATIVASPGSEYAKSQRGAQGVPAIERALEGRLWASWCTSKSPRGVESPGSYIVLVTSGDGGRTWSDLKLVVGPPRLCRV